MNKLANSLAYNIHVDITHTHIYLGLRSNVQLHQYKYPFITYDARSYLSLSYPCSLGPLTLQTCSAGIPIVSAYNVTQSNTREY